jgi:hypothetical protein
MAKKKTKKSMAELVETLTDAIKSIPKKEFENNLRKVLKKKGSPKDQQID